MKEIPLDHETARLSPALLGNWLEPDGYDIPPHVGLMGTVIRETVLGGGGFVLITMPPRHGKTTTCAKWTPLWFLDLFPKKNVIFASYAGVYSQGWGRRARNAAMVHADKLRFAVAQDSAAVGDWRTTAGGGMVAVGVDGVLTGRGADLFVIDDPVKDAVQAGSDVWRERCWEWWQQTAFSRREPGATILLVQTRWHEDDLAGRILNSSEAKRWKVLRFPAIADGPDELGRVAGDPLWPERYGLDELALIRANAGSYAWEALYQQRPAPPSGAMFKREHLGAYRDMGDHWITSKGKHLPKKDCWIGQVADCAMSEKDSADFTAVLTFASGPRGELLVLEVSRGKLDIPDQWPFILAARNRWRSHVGYRWLGAEDTGAGKALIQIARRTSEPIREIEHGSVDKVTRASLAAVVCENGNLLLPESNPEWLGPFVQELLYFPHSAKDDQVDCLAYSAMEARKARTMEHVPEEKEPVEDEDREETGNPFDLRGRSGRYGELPKGGSVYGR